MSWEAAVQRLRSDPDSQGLVKACYFDDPLRDAANRYWCSEEWKAVRCFLPKKLGTALDLGAGRGISTFALTKDGWLTTALEPNRSALVGAGAIRSLFAEVQMSVEIVEQWGEALPFLDHAFDVVYCRQVLHHARDLSQLCREIGRVLKPGGTLIATREHVVTRHDDIATFQRNHPLHHLYGGENAYLLEEYIDAIRNAGIVLKRVLNPLQSNINVAPSTLENIKAGWATRVRLPSWASIPDWVLTARGAWIDQPGRLYSFVGHKVS